MEIARRRIHDKLARRVLPTEDPSAIWAGFGGGAPCDGCERPIQNSEVEHELDFDAAAGGRRTLHFHVVCASIWRTLKERSTELFDAPPAKGCPPRPAGRSEPDANPTL